MTDIFQTLGLGPKPPDDNTVFYTLYPDKQPADDAALQRLRTRCMEVLEPLLSKPYIWQVEPFQLVSSCQVAPPWVQPQPQQRQRQGVDRPDAAQATCPSSEQQQQPGVPPSSSTITGSHHQQEVQGMQADRTPAQGGGSHTLGGGPSCLWGSVRWSDNVEDEWWVVYMLRCLTAKIPDISVQVWDNDGEFLLIEAAYALPKWLQPDTSTNRVWLRGGVLHIIPLPSIKRPHLPASPTLDQAIQILSSGIVSTDRPRADALLATRLSGYPTSGLASGSHVCRMLLPVRLAAVVRQEPQLVAAAVEAFFYRDADDMHAAARMTSFPPTDPRVPVLVRTNRCLYSQLTQQRFAPPRGWKMPPPGHPQEAAAERGLKLTAGFEILVSRAKRMGLSTTQDKQMESNSGGSNADSAGQGVQAGSGTGSTVLLDEHVVRHHPQWSMYKDSLIKSGYFEGELIGSARYKQLMSSAVHDFMQSAQAMQHQQHASASRPIPAQQLMHVLSSPSVVNAQEEDFIQGDGVGAEDDDSWMDGLGAQLEKQLEMREEEQLRRGKRNGREGNDPGPKCDLGDPSRHVDVDAGEIAGAMRGFMEYAMTGLEGAEVPLGHVDGGGGGGVEFDSSRFFRQLEQVLGGIAAEEGSEGWAQGRGRPQGGEEEEEEEDEWETTDGEGSSFFSDDDDDEEEEEEGEGGEEGEGPELLDTTPNFRSNRTQGAAETATITSTTKAATRHTLSSLQEHWEVFTATDSDDDRDPRSESGSEDEDEDEGVSESESEDGRDQRVHHRRPLNPSNSQSKVQPGQSKVSSRTNRHNQSFHEAYDQVLAEQLAETTLNATVQRAPIASDTSKDTATIATQPPQPPTQEAVKPLDLDFNLVRSLLRSVAEQQGMAGPASNLAGLLGVKLPHGTDPNAFDG